MIELVLVIIGQSVTFIVATLILWLFFVNVITWKHHEEKIPKFIKPVLYAISIAGYIFDMLFNITYGTLIFARMPHYRRLTLSARLSHTLIVESPMSWRFKVAYWTCTTLIEPWDQGHCGLGKK